MLNVILIYFVFQEKRAKDKARIRRSSTADSDAETTSPRGKGFFKKVSFGSWLLHLMEFSDPQG